MDKPFDEFEFFMKAEYISPILESIKSKNKQISYIDPNDIILNKILCGDAGDNIKSVVRYEKNGRTYRFSQKDFDNLIKDLDINTIDKLKESYAMISQYICNCKKFKQYNFKASDVKEMLIYNTKLVWLHEEVIPETTIAAMNQCEYKVFNIDDIRSNFKVLIGEDDIIKNIFESI